MQSTTNSEQTLAQHRLTSQEIDRFLAEIRETSRKRGHEANDEASFFESAKSLLP